MLPREKIFGGLRLILGSGFPGPPLPLGFLRRLFMLEDAVDLVRNARAQVVPAAQEPQQSDGIFA